MTSSALPRLWLSFVVIGLLTALALAEPAKDRKPKDRPRPAKEVVDTIVNRNRAPELVPWPSGSPRRVALFPADHDWKEEARVLAALGRLERNPAETVWEEVVRRIGDHRYCVTYTDVKMGNAYVEEVGSACRDLAKARLAGVFWRHLPLVEGKDGYVHVQLELGLNDLPSWRKQRAEKSLYELQIEVCETAIKALAKEKRVSRAEKEKARKKIRAEIEKLKRTKFPSARLDGPPDYREYGKYNAERARRVREGLASKKYGDLGIVK